MSDIKWIKLTTNMHDDEKLRLIDGLPERDSIHYLWIRLLVQAGKTNADGFIYLSETIPYTEEMLATIFCRPIESIRFALKVLSDFQMIEVAENNVIRIINWDKHQNVEGMDRVRNQNRKRVQNHREKKKQIETLVEEIKEAECNVTKNSCNVTEDKSNVTVTVQNKRENKNKIENKIKKKREIENINICGENNDLSLQNSSEGKLSLSQNQTPEKDLCDININCKELAKYAEEISGMRNVLNLSALRIAVVAHGKQHVKNAIDIALKANKPDMTYINGILGNWSREGYPEEKEVNKNVIRSYGKNSNPDKNEFKGFKPKKPRSLTDSERRKVESSLI